MIGTGLVEIVYFFVIGITLIFERFGDVPVDNNITNSIVAFKGYYTSLSDFLPLNVIVAIIAFDLSFEGIVFIYKMVRWSYKKVPTIS